jgi:hypothetical protein
LSLTNNPEYIKDLESEKPSREVGAKWNIAYSAVNKHRRRLSRGESPIKKAASSKQVEGESETHNPDGSSSYTRYSEEPWGYEDYRKFIRSRGQDPDEVTFTWGWTSNPAGGFWNKLNNVRPKSAEDLGVSMEIVERRIREFSCEPRIPSGMSPRSLVIVATDFQIGKVDWLGGTDETFEQVLTAFHRAAEMAEEFEVDEVVIVDAGDIVENEYNVSSQIATNDLSLPWQVGAAMQIMLEGIKILAPKAPSIKYVAVSSNHGQHRKGQKAPASDVHSDYGLVIANMLGTVLKLNEEAFGHVEVITPEPYMESLCFESSGSSIGVVHGHQANSPDKIGEWWKGQSHGNMPTADARILICGHWHSMRVQQSGDARWVFVGPSSDRGSSWFTNLKGESSQSGMLSFITSDNQWSDLRII